MSIITDVEIVDILNHVKDVLTSNIDTIDSVIQYYESNEKLHQIWIGDQNVLGAFPCITIEPISDAIYWGATSHTLENTYNLRIFCYIKNLKKETQVEYLIKFAEAVRRILCHPDYLRFETSSGVVYDSGVSNITFGFKKGGALRVAQIDWWSKSWVINTIGAP